MSQLSCGEPSHGVDSSRGTAWGLGPLPPLLAQGPGADQTQEADDLGQPELHRCAYDAHWPGEVCTGSPAASVLEVRGRVCAVGSPAPVQSPELSCERGQTLPGGRPVSSVLGPPSTQTTCPRPL